MCRNRAAWDRRPSTMTVGPASWNCTGWTVKPSHSVPSLMNKFCVIASGPRQGVPLGW
jgi:hypothetical protein